MRNLELKKQEEGVPKPISARANKNEEISQLVEAEADKEMPFAQAAASIVDNRNQVDAVNTVSNQKRGIENANQVLDSDSLMYQSAASQVTVVKNHFEPKELPQLNRSRSLPSEKGTVNYLEDLALTQTMFENGTLICQGEVMDFINVIRKNRNSIQNMDSTEVKNYISKHPELLTVPDDDDDLVSSPRQSSTSPRAKNFATDASLAMSGMVPPQKDQEEFKLPGAAPYEPKPSFSQKLFSKLSGGNKSANDAASNDGKGNFLNKLGFMILGANKVEAGDAGATPICESVRARLNSDGFLDLESNPNEEEKKEEVPDQFQAPKPEKPLRLRQENAEKQDGLQIDMYAKIEIEDDYILTSHLGDW